MTKPIALQLYTIREQLAHDWQGTLEWIAEIGYIGVETAGFGYAPSRQAAVDLLNELGLQVIGAHSPLLTKENESELIDMMQALGNDRIIAAGLQRDGFETQAGIEARIAEYNAAADIARKHGLKFGLHNHWWEFAKVDGKVAYETVINALDEDVFLEVDTYWVQTAGYDAAEFVAKMDARSALLHIKDGPCTTDGNMVAVGSGKMDVPAVIAAGKSAEHLIVELDRCGTDMMQAVTDSYNYLVGNGLARGNK
ncbi:MAG: sugar phosphate isomerase/epimerase family protein [Candidatus Promineifilaceae bacterium]